MTTATVSRPSPVGRILALAGGELRLLLRNRTVAVSSIAVPLGLGLFWAFTFRGDGPGHSIVLALQLAVVLGMSIYVTATQIVVARRQSRVLKRMRTTAMSDGELLTATVLPTVVLGLVQLLLFAAINAATGIPLPVDPVPLTFAVLGGVVLAVTAALATTVVTPSAERAQITTLPLMLVLLGSAIILAIAPAEGVWQAAVVVPGAAVGQLVQLSMTGTTWTPAALGLPAVLPAVVALVAWSAVFARVAARRFRWDPRG